jgi:hypothetical protein
VSAKTNVFTIGEAFLAQKGRNIFWGAVLSVFLVAAIGFGHYRYPETYNDVLLWSVVAFVVGANLINYVRHRRYLRLIRDHSVKVGAGKVKFRTGTEASELALEDVVLINLFRRRGVLRHIQIKLKNNRGIRLEGYEDLDHLAALLEEQIPSGQIIERKI